MLDPYPIETFSKMLGSVKRTTKLSRNNIKEKLKSARFTCMSELLLAIIFKSCIVIGHCDKVPFFVIVVSYT